LTDKDTKKRYLRALLWQKKPLRFWTDKTFIDNKKFVIPATEAQRKQLLQSKCIGHLRTPQEGTTKGFTKAKTNHCFIGKSVDITAAVTSTRIIVFHENKKRWCGAVAAEMYKGVLKPALVKHRGEKRHHVIVEDGDPAGYQSSRGKRAKKEAKIKSLVLPPRTPQWMPLDFSVWNEIERKVLQSCTGRVSKKAYVAKLKRAATVDG
jgi:hypothetical protein